jgi:hypothetical protein
MDSGIVGLELERLVEVSQGLGKQFENIFGHAAVLIGIGELWVDAKRLVFALGRT